MKLRVLVTTIAGIGLSLVTAAPAIASPTQSTPEWACGTVLTTDATLHADLTCVGTGIAIGAAGVTVNLAGHTIRGDGVSTGILDVFPGYRNVTIRHGTIANFGVDVMLEDADDVTLDHVRLEGGGAGWRGVNGVYAMYSQNLRLTDVSLVDTGVRLETSGNATISRSTFQHSDLHSSWSSTALRFAGNALTDSSIMLRQADDVVIAGNGFARSSLSVSEMRNLTVRDNRIVGADVGFAAELVTDGLQVTGNTFVHNRVGLSTGLVIAGAMIARNSFVANGETGLLLASGPVTGAVRGNAFIGNGDGLRIAVVSGSDVVVGDNHSRGNAAYGIVVAGPVAVRDGGGNTSAHDPLGCVGVVCR
jgi:nitrous oxidase accessory protein NosD